MLLFSKQKYIYLFCIVFSIILVLFKYSNNSTELNASNVDNEYSSNCSSKIGCSNIILMHEILCSIKGIILSNISVVTYF